MAIYEVRCVHHRRAWRKGDLESEDIFYVFSDVFKTRKEANSYLKRKEAEAVRNRCKAKINIVNRGDKESELLVFTGDSWIHENTGDTHHEYYWYRVIKK